MREEMTGILFYTGIILSFIGIILFMADSLNGALVAYNHLFVAISCIGFLISFLSPLLPVRYSTDTRKIKT